MSRMDPKISDAARERLKDALPPRKRLRALRQAVRFSQEKLGDALGVSGVAVNDWENDKRTPTAANAAMLAAWSRKVVAELGLDGGVAALSVDDWFSPEERAQIDALNEVPPCAP